ncbi:MAG: helicase HerA-like domain-containing protein [Candidatus Phlomobacter fragariae]
MNSKALITFSANLCLIVDLIKTESNCQGIVNILAADKLYNQPKLYYKLYFYYGYYRNFLKVYPK